MKVTSGRISGLSLLACLASLGVAPGAAWAISEGSGFQAELQSKVMPYFGAGKKEGFSGVNGVWIETLRFEVEGEKGALVILPGKGESYAKYAELAYDLKDSGYSVYLIDHRGQGYSGRMTDDSQMEYVDELQDYVTDVATFVDRIVNARPHAHRYLLAHSMGGAIGTLYLMQHPTMFEKAVLSAPMHQINAGMDELLAYSIVSSSSVLFGKCYALNQGPWDAGQGFGSQTLTHSASRFSAQHELEKADPRLQIGGASNNWVRTSIEATVDIRENAGQVITPVLLLQAGMETLVMNGGQDEFCAKARSCVKVAEPFRQSYHELFMEQDPIRNEAIRLTLGFFANP